MTEHGSSACPPRWATPRNPDRPTLGPAVAELAAELGIVLMPWQRRVVDVALELDPATGLPWYRDIGVSVGRQSGKSTLVLPTAAHRAIASEPLGWGRRPLLKVLAQNGVMARRRVLDEMWPRIDRDAPRLRRQVSHIVKSAAREAIVFANGAKIETGGNTRDANHGLVIAAAWLDECFAYGPDGSEEQGVRPAMATMPAAQMWALSAAGDADSVWWNGYQDQGRDLVESGLDSRACYFEWSADEAVDLDDEATWPTVMPGLAEGLVTPDVIRADRDRMGPGEFSRAYGNRRTGAAELLFPVLRWAACAGELVPTDALQLSVDVGYAAEGKPRQSAIAVAGWSGDWPVVEVLELGDGTAWVVPRVKELFHKHRAVWVTADDRGPVAALHRDLRRAIPESRLKFLGTAEVCGAAEQFHQAILDRRVVHRGQAELAAAVNGAKRRPVGEAWAYGRKASSSNVTPLVAVSLAYHQLVSRGRVLTELM